MRMVQILFFLILISCGNATQTESSVTNVKTEQEPSSSTTSNTSDSGVDYSINKPSLDPIMGGPADISIKVNGIGEGKSYLIAFVAEGHFRLDSCTVRNDIISYKKDEGYPQGLYYVSLPNNQYVQVILSEDQELNMECEHNNINGTMKVQGSKENTIYYENLLYESTYNAKFQNLSRRLKNLDQNSAEYKDVDGQRKQMESERTAMLNKIFEENPKLLFTEFKRSGQNPKIRETGTDAEKIYHYRKEFWDNVNFADPRLIRTPVIINKLKRYFNELTPKNPDSIFVTAKGLVDRVIEHPQYFKFFANWIALNYEPTKTDLMDPESVFVNMIQNYFTKELAFWSDSMEVYGLQRRAYEMAQSLVGKQGPDVVSTNQNGETKSIYEKTAEYIVVYLYNPTCEHCMKETPLLVDWYNKNKRNNYADVFAIAIDTNEKEWKEYIKKNNMEFTNVFDPTNKSIYAKYYVDITPEIYVLNKERKIIGKNLKVFQIDTIIEREKNGN